MSMVHVPGYTRKISNRGRQSTGTANPIDQWVGQRLRLLRCASGVSQDKLGKAIGLTFQQVQKYESGDNRLSASRMWDICQVLGITPNDLFAAAPAAVAAASPAKIDSNKEEVMLEALRGSRGILEIARHYFKLSPGKQEALRVMAKSLDFEDGAQPQP